jgi:hypothetical protein
MKHRHFWITLWLVVGICCPPAGAADAPTGLAGILLGKDITESAAALNMATAMPVRHLETFMEVETHPMDGFKSGLVGYSTCAAPGKILRLKLKYADSSSAFFKELLKRYRSRFGTPAEWRGDPFHVVQAWKWSFTDKDQNRISMILQNNTMDQEEKKGTSVKMTLTNLLEKEVRCMEDREAKADLGLKPSGAAAKTGTAINWDQLLPR